MATPRSFFIINSKVFWFVDQKPFLLLDVLQAAIDHCIMKKLLFLLVICPSIAFGQSAMEHFNEGILYYKTNKPYEAIQAFNEALQIQPDLAGVHYLRGLCKNMVHDQNGALQDLNIAESRDPDNINILIRRAEIKAAMNDLSGCIIDAERVLRITPEGKPAVHALYLIGKAQYTNAMYDEAINTYTRITELDPDDAEAYFNRGTAKGMKEDHKGSIDDYNSAIELDPHFATAFGNRGVAKVILEDKESACSDLVRAKELGDDSIDQMLVIYCD